MIQEPVNLRFGIVEMRRGAQAAQAQRDFDAVFFAQGTGDFGQIER